LRPPRTSGGDKSVWAAAALVVSVGAVAVDAWASDAAVLARFCDAASLRGFDEIRDLSFNHSIHRNNLQRRGNATQRASGHEVDQGCTHEDPNALMSKSTSAR